MKLKLSQIASLEDHIEQATGLAHESLSLFQMRR